MFNSLLRNDNNIGKSSEDFSILEIISKKENNFVAKVKSKLNNKTYAMKRIEKNQENSKYIEREKFFIKYLNNVNIVKYYVDFEENNFLYLITEYVDNGDLMQMINSITNKAFKFTEENLIKIMLQCLKALSYLNYCGIIFCALKPDRILLDNDFNIKLTNFKYAVIYDETKAKQNLSMNHFNNDLINDYTLIHIGEYKAPEVKQGSKYDKRIDVYSLGITFCLLAYSKTKLPDNKEDYSDDLYNFIKKMVDESPNRRPKATDAYKELKNIYLKKYFHSSSIISYLRCLSSLPNIKDNFLSLIKTIIKEGENPILKKLYNFITIIEKVKQLNLSSEEDFRNKIKEEINEEIYDFLEYLQAKKIIKSNIKREVTPKEFSCILFQLIGSELKLSPLNVDININEIIKDINYISPKDKLYNLLNYFNFTSPISESFDIISKKEEKCLNCNKIKNEYYRKNQFLLINLELFQNNLDINEIIKSLYKIETSEEQCVFCNKITNIEKRKSLFNLSKDLIIILDRGEECTNKNFINFPDTLTIDKKIIELKRGNGEQYLYTLYGALIRKEKNDESGYNKRIEDYIYYTKDLNENYFTRNDSSKTYNLCDIKSEGDVIGLFYYCEDLDNNNNNSNNQSSQQEQGNKDNNNNNIINNQKNINENNISQLMNEINTKDIVNGVPIYNNNNNMNNNNMNNNNFNSNNINISNFNASNNQNNNINNMPINSNQNQVNFNQQQHMSGLNTIKIMNNFLMNSNNNNNNINNNNNFVMNNNLNNFNNNINNNNQGFNPNNQINNNQNNPNFFNSMNMNNNQNNMANNSINNNGYNNIFINNNRQLNQNNMYQNN